MAVEGAKQQRIEELLANNPWLPRYYVVSGGIDFCNGLYELSLLEAGEPIPPGRGSYGANEFRRTPKDKRYHWVNKDPSETGSEIWWSTTWCWGISYRGDHHYCDEGGSEIPAHRRLAPRDPDNLGRLPREVLVPRTKFGNIMGADESWSPVTLTPVHSLTVVQLAAVAGDNPAVLATALSGRELARVPLEPADGPTELRQKLGEELELRPAAMRVLLPNGKLLRDVTSAGELQESLSLATTALGA